MTVLRGGHGVGVGVGDISLHLGGLANLGSQHELGRLVSAECQRIWIPWGHFIPVGHNMNFSSEA